MKSTVKLVYNYSNETEYGGHCREVVFLNMFYVSHIRERERKREAEKNREGERGERGGGGPF